MKHFFLFWLIIAIFCLSCNNKQPFKIELKTINATVIMKENCRVNPDKDFWLLDLEPADGSKIGDTIEIGGDVYNHVVKADNFPAELKISGVRLRIKYYELSSERVLISNCPASDSLQYAVHMIPINGYEKL